MFCPIGYVTSKKIMDENFERISWTSLRLDGIFEKVFELDDGRTSARMAKRLTKNELIEKVVFETAFLKGILMCAPDGRLLKLDVPIFRVADYWFDIDRQEPKFFDDDFSYAFDTYILSSVMKNIDELLKEKKDPWRETKDCGFTSLNYFFSRADYSISTNVFKTVEALSHYCWSFGSKLTAKLDRVAPFEGWSLCVSEDAANLLSPQALHDKLRLRFVSETLNMDESEFEKLPSQKNSTGGRPKVRDDAAQAFLKHFTPEDRPSWKEVVQVLRSEEGLEVSPRSLQRGISELNRDKT